MYFIVCSDFLSHFLLSSPLHPFRNPFFEQDPYSNEYVVAKIGFDTAKNEPSKVCPLSVYRSPRYMDEGEGEGPIGMAMICHGRTTPVIIPGIQGG